MGGTCREGIWIAAFRGGEFAFSARHEPLAYNRFMERKVFWMVFMALGLVADFLLPLWWGIAATIPIVFIAWWVAYRSDWF